MLMYCMLQEAEIFQIHSCCDMSLSLTIVFKEWRDTRTFSNLKSTHGTLLILLIINLVTKKSLCVVSKVQREQ
jgi:hypothetical protein